MSAPTPAPPPASTAVRLPLPFWVRVTAEVSIDFSLPFTVIEVNFTSSTAPPLNLPSGLASITTPLAPSPIVGNLNDITVSDNRGGSFGWTLSATMPAFTGSPNSNTIAASRLAATPACAPATNATAWDYEAVGKTAITGFDATLNAPGVSAGGAGQNFGSAVNLCTKDGQENPTTQSSGGVYNVTSTLTLTVPAFQAADRYTSTITVLLA